MKLIKKLILETLKPLSVPVCLHKYIGNESTYITFHEYSEKGEIYEEDEEIFTGHYIQVDVWSKNDYTTIVDLVKELLKRVGFKRIDEVDLYENDSDLYHKGLRFFYLEEKEVI